MIENIDLEHYDTIDIKDLDKNTYFHYTNINSLENIFHEGLKPAIGENAMGIEQSEKVFFTIGGTNSLILMESWLRWLIAKSITDVPGKKFDGPIYKLATWLIKLKFFQPLTTYITKCELRSNPLKVREYKRLAKILDDSIYLSLDLEYGIDYSLNDIDEVKNGNFDRKLLALMYNKSNINDNRIEYWNMHTFYHKKVNLLSKILC